jgi:hypothetical protein
MKNDLLFLDVSAWYFSGLGDRISRNGQLNVKRDDLKALPSLEASKV